MEDKTKEVAIFLDELVIEALAHIKKICGGERGIMVPVIYELYDIARTNNVSYIGCLIDNAKKTAPNSEEGE